MTAKPLTYWRTTETPQESDSDTVVLEAEPEPVDQAEAERAWADAAPGVLTTVAGTYQGLITHTDLAARLQDESGIRTRSNPGTWIDRVLSLAAADDVAAGRPPLTALCVHKVQGTVGASYATVLEVTGHAPIADEVAREKHAAEARMECYRWADAKMPTDGGRAALSPKFAMITTRERKKARDEAVPTVCPSCNMSIPPTGVCDNCG